MSAQEDTGVRERLLEEHAEDGADAPPGSPAHRGSLLARVLLYAARGEAPSRGLLADIEVALGVDALASALPSGDGERLRAQLVEFDAWLSMRGEFGEVLTAFRTAFGTDTSAPALSGEAGGGARCSMCGGLGWTLDCNDIGKPGPRMVELLPCLLPDCAASGQPLQSITFGHGPSRFTTAAMHPSEGWIMAVRNPKETP